MAVTISEMPLETLPKEEDEEAKAKRYQNFEKVILEMQNPNTGIVIKDRKLLLRTVPSCFIASEMITWLLSFLKFKDRNEATYFSQKLVKDGYIFPTDDYLPVIDNNEQFMRFQTPYFWPSITPKPSDFDYAVYLVKLNMKKGTKGMKPYELGAFANLQRKLRKRWEFIVQQASDQIAASKDRTSVQAQIFESQERAFWWIHRPPKKQEAIFQKILQQQECEVKDIDPRSINAPKWGKSLLALLSDPDGYKMFRDHLTSEHNEENLDFWEACEKFEKSDLNDEDMEKEIKIIWNKYCVQNAPNEVNIPASIREKISKNLKKRKFTKNIFEQAKLAIQNLMSNDIYIRFLKTPEYIDLLKTAQTQGWLNL